MPSHDITKVTQIAAIIYRNHPESLSEAAGVARLILDNIANDGADPMTRLLLFRTLRGQHGDSGQVYYRGRTIAITDRGADPGVVVLIGGSLLEAPTRKTQHCLALLRDIDMLIGIGSNDDLATIPGGEVAS